MLLNNTPHGYVQLSSSMGLRQMDPLSPYLFLHCVWLDLKRGNGKEKSKGMEIVSLKILIPINWLINPRIFM